MGETPKFAGYYRDRIQLNLLGNGKSERERILGGGIDWLVGHFELGTDRRPELWSQARLFSLLIPCRP